MARHWFAFDVCPEAEYGSYREMDVTRAYVERIEAWVRDNKRGSARVAMISGKSREGKTDYDDICSHVRVKFRSYRDAVLFKMFFGDDICAPRGPLVSRIRRVSPTIIAREIIGVSPMCAPNRRDFPKLSKIERRKRNKLRDRLILAYSGAR